MVRSESYFYRVDLKAGNAPLPRTDHTFVKYKNAFFVYGGRDEMHIFSDIYEFKISKACALYLQMKTNGSLSKVALLQLSNSSS